MNDTMNRLDNNSESLDAVHPKEEKETMTNEKVEIRNSNENFVDGDDHDDAESSDDENAHLKQLRPGQNSSIRRNDSFTSFITRSERKSLFGEDPPPTEQEAAKRRVKFCEPLFDVYEIEKVDNAIKDQYWMNDEDFDRIETDLKVTQFRYENYKNGKIPFDEEQNTVRGLESMISDDNLDMKMHKHQQSVLHEIHQQKAVHGCVFDWEKVRLTSEKFSAKCRANAAEVGKQDEIDFKEAWGMIAAKTKQAVSKVHGALEDKKKRNPFLFWKKR
jgi:hypothetical protein